MYLKRMVMVSLISMGQKEAVAEICFIKTCENLALLAVQLIVLKLINTKCLHAQYSELFILLIKQCLFLYKLINAMSNIATIVKI